MFAASKNLQPGLICVEPTRLEHPHGGAQSETKFLYPLQTLDWAVIAFKQQTL